MQRLFKLWLASLLLVAVQAWAFDEQQLTQQLASIDVLRGEFVQEKHLRGLPRPLHSEGHFVLSREQGLLWSLQRPLPRDYRITGQGVFLWQQGQWQTQGNQDAAARQSRLFLAVLRGDQQGLRNEFELQLQGSADGWLLTLQPKSLLLQQIFQRIEVRGDRHVRSIELLETRGDRTLMRMEQVIEGKELQADERAAFAS